MDEQGTTAADLCGAHPRLDEIESLSHGE